MQLCFYLSKCKCKDVAAAEAVILALVIAVALTPVVEETKLNAAATSLASAPASILAVLVPKETPFTV